MSTDVVGTIEFMSPEQAQTSKKADERSDIFSLGAILYLMLTGQKWFSSSGNLLSDITKLSDMEPPAPRKVNGKLPKDLETIVLTAMEKDPSRRYQNAALFRDDIVRFMNDEGIQARPTSVIYKATKFVKKHRKIVLPSAAAVIIAITSISIFYGERLKEAVTWRLIYKDDFNCTTEDLAKNWTAIYSPDWTGTNIQNILFNSNSRWQVISNELQGTGMFACNDLVFRRQIPGNMRIEWKARMLKRPEGYNAFIAGMHRFNAYDFHIGGWYATNAVVFTRGKNLTIMDIVHHKTGFVTNRYFNFRMEKEGHHIRLFINGVTVLDIIDYDDLMGGEHQQFGFDIPHDNILAIDNVRVYAQPPPMYSGNSSLPIHENVN